MGECLSDGHDRLKETSEDGYFFPLSETALSSEPLPSQLSDNRLSNTVLFKAIHN